MKAFLTDFAEMMRAMILGLVLIFAFALAFWVFGMVAADFSSIVDAIGERVVSIWREIPFLPQMKIFFRWSY